jgi:hypothetical protein
LRRGAASITPGHLAWEIIGTRSRKAGKKQQATDVSEYYFGKNHIAPFEKYILTHSQ